MWNDAYIITDEEHKPDELCFTDKNWVRIRKDFEYVEGKGWFYKEKKVPKEQWDLYSEVRDLRKEVERLKDLIKEK